MSSTIKSFLKKLQKKIDKTGNYYVYYRDKKTKKYTLIVKENCWKDLVTTTQRKLKKLKKRPKYIIVAYMQIELDHINITPEDKDIVNGPLLITVKAHEVRENLSLGSHAYKDRSQNIWYTKENLLKRRFSFSDVKKSVKVVNESKVSQNPFARVMITDVLSASSS
jgi:tRNA/tmRNA/rRNA uracil-C5-methylase (TrmA/RlmC/RlmD family)